MTEIYFFGVLRAGEAGHYLYTDDGREPRALPAGFPWSPRDLDGGLTWNAGAWIESASGRRRESARGPCIQGDAAMRYRDGWTVIAWHDFTGDQRGGSNSALFARGVFTAAEMWALLERHFPLQHRRQPGPPLLKHQDDPPCR